LSVVLLRFHALLGPMRHRLVCKCTDRISNPAGMSGGLLAPMAQMMIARAAGKHMTRIMGYAAVPIVLGPILGPVIAGTILQFASWRWLFLVNLPVGALAITLAIFFLPNDREETKQ